jgi:hypothetical protein
MKLIEQYIAEKQRAFAAHPFFARLQAEALDVNALDFAPGLTFWVFTFQDVLRLNEQRMQDPALRKIARHHSAEDKGHEAWFVDDVAAIDPTPRDFGWLFGRHHEHTRDASYALVAEVFRATSDYNRIVLLLTLESAGHVFFERVARYVEKMQPNTTLRYFSHWHLAVEKDHELFEEELHEQLDVDFDPAQRASMMAMIDRSYDAFNGMFSGLEERFIRRASGFKSISPARTLAANETGPIKKTGAS